MSLSSYLIALFSGVLLYLVMILDAKYIEPNDKQISPKIPLFVTLLVWMICVFYKTDGSNIPVAQQTMLHGSFYSK
jgi:hypothetical protein